MTVTNPSIRLISLNIERRKHLNRIFSFLQEYKPDVVCMQELFEKDVPYFEQELGMKMQFVAMTLSGQGEKGVGTPMPMGIGIMSALPMTEPSIRYYYGNPDSLPNFVWLEMKTVNRMLLYTTVTKYGTAFTVGTTHFSWTPDGKANNRQRGEIQKLLAILADIPEIVFCGDFNAPRGGEIFAAIAQKYTDNIPQHYTTSIDGTLHRTGSLPYLVDGLFSTPYYKIKNVSLQCGVSDHCAIVAEVKRIST